MRLFIGTSIPPRAIDLIETALRDLRKDSRWRFAPMEQWHVTTLFIGDRDEAVIPSFKKAINELASVRTPITLSNGKICTMPEVLPRMLWIKFDPTEVLTELHHTLAKALKAKVSPHLPYQSHITLARSNQKPDHYSGPVVLKKMMLDHLTLFRTHLSPAGSIHHPIETWKLNGTDPIVL